MERRGKGLKGREKAAVLLVSLGPDVASRVYKNLDESTIEMLTMEIAGLRKIPSNQREEVLREAQELLLAKEYMTQGGVDYAKQLLESALGPERAQDILRRITASLQVRPFGFYQADRSSTNLGLCAKRAPSNHSPDSFLYGAQAGSPSYGRFTS